MVVINVNAYQHFLMDFLNSINAHVCEKCVYIQVCIRTYSNRQMSREAIHLDLGA